MDTNKNSTAARPVAYHNGKVIYKLVNGYRIGNKSTIYPSSTAAARAIDRSKSYDI